MPSLLLTLATFFAVAILFPLGVIAIALAWPWLVDRVPRMRSSSQFHHGIAMTLGTAAGLYLRQNALELGDELLGGGIMWFIAITVGVIAYGLSAITVGITTQMRREKERGR